MPVVWSAICALAALAAEVQQAQPAPAQQAQTRTRVLPGHGYIRYEVLPGDEQAEGGQLIVVHEDRQPAPPPDASAAADDGIRDSLPARPAARPLCSGLRAKLLARVFEMQGMQIEPEFAAWLEKNLTLGSSGVRTIQLLGGDPLLLTALKADGVARGLAEDLARCEAADRR